MSTRTNRNTERGAALLLVMFAIILVSGFGVLLYFSSGTETRIDANYGGSLNAYYAARFGLEEVRDRAKYSALSLPANNGIAELLPADIAGNTGGVLYIVNPANGETVDPTDINSRYFDDQLCHDFNSGIPNGSKCASSPTAANWNMIPLTSVAPAGTALPYKWVRINMKTNRISYPYYVDATNLPATLDTRVCWDGVSEQLSPGGANPSCDANGMQTVYMLTSMAVTPGVSQLSSRKVLRAELVAPAIRPPGAVTMDAASVSPLLSAGSIPSTAIDGRVHKLDGTLAPTSGTTATVYGGGTLAPPNRCSAVAAVATDTTQAATQMVQQLDTLRQNIVTSANASCNFDGTTPTSSATKCTPPLWWVRGVGATPRYAVPTSPTGTTGTTGTGTTGSGSGSTSGGSGGDDHGGHGSSGGPSSGGSGSATGTGTTGTGTTGTTGTGTTTPGTFAPLCDPTASASCYANLDLTAPELMAVSASIGPTGQLQMGLPANPSSPFVGGSGNSLDPAIYQAGLPHTVPNEIATVAALVSASVGQANYMAIPAASLSPLQTYGSNKNPVILKITDATGVKLTSPLIGFGILVVSSDLEIQNSTKLQWTGIVLVQGGSAQFVVGAGATGFINGTLMLQPAAATAASIQTSTAAAANPLIPIGFRISYSCDAIDMAFSSLPYKTISSSETSF